MGVYGLCLQEVRQAGFDGDFDARFCLAEGEVSGHATFEEVPDRSCWIAVPRLVFESGRPIAHVALILGSPGDAAQARAACRGR